MERGHKEVRVGLRSISEIGDVHLRERLRDIRGLLEQMEGAIVAFSGGVDSSLLLTLANEICKGKVIAVTASSQTYPRRELESARQVARLIGCEHLIIKTNELEDPRFSSNPLDRCYYCKLELFARLKAIATERGLSHILEGSTVDDLGDFRPGERALRELGVASPLRQASFTKQDVRSLARMLGLPNWDKPASACLASRFAYGLIITSEDLRRIEKLEDLLHELGFAQVRARFHGELVRIEVEPSRVGDVAGEVRNQVIQAARRLGFRYVTLDLQGYRTGSFNPEGTFKS